ncbi:uncharacterized protein LOC119696404 isoform X2 [Motacilla alba alba]|uniref:uncharacterized protein LOC119696404 isoform X2 n=1 Tax=Motacilla alba alba TaxID=1094192 RepID=UPI0018D52BF7|nr:uncharacterized protein LOC119696404 isoform X2 [Motacilla alba alba]
MEPKLSLEQRTERLVQRRGRCPGSHVTHLRHHGQSGDASARTRGCLHPCLSPRNPCGRSPAGGHMTPTKPSGRRGAALWIPCRGQGTHSQEPFWGSHDCLGALWCAPYWKSCDSQDALWPAREALPEPLRRGGPGLRSGDPREAPQPIRSSARDALQRAPWQQPLGPSRPSWNAHLSTPAHGGANKAMRPQNCTGEPARPRGGSRDCGSHHAPRPRQSRRSRECPLRSVPAAPQGCRKDSALAPAAPPHLGSCSRRNDNGNERTWDQRRHQQSEKHF